MTDLFAKPPVLPAAAEEGVRAATWVAFTEGPAVDADGTVYFSDIINNRIMKLSPSGERSVFRQPSGRTNGQTFDRQGRLLHCEGNEFGRDGNRRVTRTNLQTGAYEIITDRYEGKRYNAPNDICLDGRGRIFFTDPSYDHRDMMEMDTEGVYRIDLDGTVTRILGQEAVERPNGLAVTQDAKTLYVVDACPVPGGNRKIWDFDLDEAGSPSNRRLMIDFAPGRGGDGMRLDIEGNLYIAAGVAQPRHAGETDRVRPAVYVVSPAGELLGHIPVPEDLITNCAFGGDDGRTLYITSGKSLYKTRTAIPGQVAYPEWENVR